MPRYTDPALVTDARITPIPRHGQTVSGYGGRIPTRYMIRYMGVWRRVYAMVYGNAGSVYVNVKGSPVFLDIETEYSLEDMGRDTDV